MLTSSGVRWKAAWVPVLPLPEWLNDFAGQVGADLSWSMKEALSNAFQSTILFSLHSATGSPPVPTVVPALALLRAHLFWGQLAPQFYTHTWVQIWLQRLPGFYLNSLAPVKSSRLNIVQTSRLLPGFKNLLKILLAILVYCYQEFCL